MKRLSLINSIPLGIGSIIGSGILFLPSLTYKVSGPDVLLSWGLIILLCFPGIIFFKEMIQKVQVNNSSLSGIVELGLGREVGKSVHLIMFGTVIFGMPSAAIVAGSYCEEVIPFPYIKEIVAYFLIFFALVINYFGLKTSSILSFLLSALLVFISVYIIIETKQPLESYASIKPQFNLNLIYSGAVLAFWAFAGFENLTFLYPEFKNPQRDLIVTIVVSVLICGAIYVCLVANYAAIVPYSKIKDTTGLLQMVSKSKNSNITNMLALFAFLAVLINLVSWTGGIVKLIRQAAESTLLPASLKDSDSKALVFLGLFFVISTTLGLLSPFIFQKILTVVSTNFLVLYLLSIISYLFVTQKTWKKVCAFLIAASILVTLSSSSYLLIYPFLIYLYTFYRLNKTA